MRIITSLAVFTGLVSIAHAQLELNPAAEQRLDTAPALFRYAEPPAEKPAEPEHAEEEGTELAKKLVNPVSDLISVPFQFNWDEGIGPKDAGRLLLNIQPVVPMSISDDWNLIIRTIVPVIYQESPAEGVDDEFGLGDSLQSFFFSPKKGGLIWGVGPAFYWPTATDGDLGTRQWGLGPTAVVLRQSQGWTIGCLANHVWSYAGESDGPDLNQTFIQPFVAYTWPTATTLSLNTESTYFWDQGDWSVPLNLVAGQVVKLGHQPVQFQLGGRWYADTTPGGPEWGLRFSIVFLFPK